MPKVLYPDEVNGKLVTENGSLPPICSLSNRSLPPTLTVHLKKFYVFRVQTFNTFRVKFPELFDLKLNYHIENYLQFQI